MGLEGADRLDGDPLEEEGEAVHPHAHSRSLRHRCKSNNAVVAIRPPHQEGEDTIREDEGEIKSQQPPLDLVLVYLHNAGCIFRYFTPNVKYILSVH
jgi:hypothetical protein